MKKRIIAGVALLCVAGFGSYAATDRVARSWVADVAVQLGLVDHATPSSFGGYVEADYVMVGSSIGGTLARLDVKRGDRVSAGTSLFVLDDTAERAARDEATAKRSQAEALHADLLSGKRPPEIAAVEAQLRQAQAAYRNAESDYDRQVRLRESGVVAVKSLDEARAQRDSDRARIAELEAQLRVARLPGRDDAIRAAESAAAAARAAVDQAEWRLAQKRGAAPADAVVIDTLYRPGEMVAAGMPVVKLLPPANVKIRFFVPETMLMRVGVGEKVSVACDGCGAPIAATVTFVSPTAEYTPPVIYSRERRARLVYMVEARPDSPAIALRVGQPADVTLARQ
jgi:HlyD family secretion protein